MLGNLAGEFPRCVSGLNHKSVLKMPEVHYAGTGNKWLTGFYTDLLPHILLKFFKAMIFPGPGTHFFPSL